MTTDKQFKPENQKFDVCIQLFVKNKYNKQQQTQTIELQAPDIGQAPTECVSVKNA